MTAPFAGVGVALVTLFDDRGEVDAAATAAHAARLVSLGVRAVVVAGSTGEAAALDPDERTALLVAVRAAVPESVPVLAGTGAASARQAARLTSEAAAADASAALVLSPPHTRDPGPYYDTVDKAAAGLPLLAYHYPKVSPPGIPVAALPGLPVVGVKDSTGDAARLLALLDGYDGAVYVGSSALVHTAGALGAAGAILALANSHPEDCVAAFAGDPRAQRRLTGPHHAMDPFPAGIKALVAQRFGTSEARRMG